MSKQVQKPFRFVAEEMFGFTGGITVFVGRVEDEGMGIITPSDVDVMVDGERYGSIHLECERMPGPRHPGLRAVETRSTIDLNKIRGKSCVLCHPGIGP